MEHSADELRAILSTYQQVAAAWPDLNPSMKSRAGRWAAASAAELSVARATADRSVVRKYEARRMGISGKSATRIGEAVPPTKARPVPSGPIAIAFR